VKCKENGVRDKSYGRFSMQIKYHLKQVEDSYRVCWMIVGTKNKIFRVFLLKNAKENEAEQILWKLACKVQTLSQMSGRALT